MKNLMPSAMLQNRCFSKDAWDTTGYSNSPDFMVFRHYGAVYRLFVWELPTQGEQLVWLDLNAQTVHRLISIQNT
jgi:hypothetical protein